MRPILYLNKKRPSLLRSIAAGPPVFFDLSSVKEEVKDDDVMDSSVKFQGGFGLRMNRYKPGSLEKLNAIASNNKISVLASESNLEPDEHKNATADTNKLKSIPNYHFDPIPMVDPPSFPKSSFQESVGVKKNKIPLRQARRVARNEQILSAGPGGSPGAFAKRSSRPDHEHEKKMINSATSLSDLLLVSSDRDLPMIDILSRVATENPTGMASSGVSRPGAGGDVELWASSSPRSRFKLHIDEDDAKPKFAEVSKVTENPLSEHDIFFE